VLADQSRRSSGCGGSGPRRGLGSRVHGGPKVLNEGVCDLGRTSQDGRPGTHASKGRWRARRRQRWHDGALPAQARERVPDHHVESAWVLHVVGELAHASRDSGARLGRPWWLAPEWGGTASPASDGDDLKLAMDLG
jgi:hypothetical protein